MTKCGKKFKEGEYLCKALYCFGFIQLWLKGQLRVIFGFVVNGAAASFPEVIEETSEWVTAIGGDDQSAHILTSHGRSCVIEVLLSCVCICVCRGHCGILACHEGGRAARRGGGGLSN